jgi:hypothetical protein
MQDRRLTAGEAAIVLAQACAIGELTEPPDEMPAWDVMAPRHQLTPRVHVMAKSLYTDVLARVASPPNASLLFAMVLLVAVYLAVWLMDRRGWYLKL